MKLRLLAATFFAFIAVQAFAADAKPRVIEVTSSDAMKFSVDKIEAKAGETITIKLTNNGTQPKDVMGHNFVLLKPGTDITSFATASMAAKATDFIGDSVKDKVVGHVPVLGPKGTGEFTVKLDAGEYPFLCTFPGHFALMKGVLIVK